MESEAPRGALLDGINQTIAEIKAIQIGKVSRVLKESDLGKSFIKAKLILQRTKDHIYDEDHAENIVVNANSGGGVADKQFYEYAQGFMNLMPKN